MGGAHAAEAPALHRAGKALALGEALDVDHLAGDEMVGGDLRADVEQRILVDAELGDLRLGLHLGLAEMAALRLGDVLRLGRAGAELDGDIAVAAVLAAGDDLQSSSARTVTGTWRPSSWNRRVIPTFFAITPVRMTKLLHYRGPHRRHDTHPAKRRVQPENRCVAPSGLVPRRRGKDGGRRPGKRRRYPFVVSPA